MIRKLATNFTNGHEYGLERRPPWRQMLNETSTEGVVVEVGDIVHIRHSG